MKRLASGLLLLALAFPSALLAAEAGTVTRLRGDASAEAAGRLHPLATGGRVDIGEKLHTGPGARLELRLIDGTSLTLGERADFTVDELVVSDTHGSALFHLAAGAFRMAAGAIAKTADHKVEVTATYGTIGIRGTEVWGGPLVGVFDVFLIEGVVDVTSPAGRVTLDVPGQGTSVATPGAAPEKPRDWTPNRIARALATVSFEAP